MTWCVVISPSAWFGKVGRVAELSGRRVEVQFGANGPFKTFSRNAVLPIAPLLRQIEQNTGSVFRPDDD